MSQAQTVGSSGKVQAGVGRLPDFLIIGAAKAGTTTLYNYLKRHPNVFCAKPGEPEFFARDEVFERGLGWYSSLFSTAPAGAVCGEKSTAYTRHPQHPKAADRIARFLPDVKLIYMLRHPVERAYSHYVHRVTVELHPGEPVPCTFEEHVERDPMCLGSSEYMTQIERYMAHFPRSSLLCLFHEDFVRDPGQTLRRILDFLEVDPAVDLLDEGPIHKKNSRRHHEHRARDRLMAPLREAPIIGALGRRAPQAWKDGVYRLARRLPRGRRVERSMTPPPMRPETRRRLIERFRESNRRLEEWLGRDLSHWNQ